MSNAEAACFVVVALAAVVLSVMMLGPLQGGFWVDFLTPPSTPDVGREVFQFGLRRSVDAIVPLVG
jgi:hypothetical protein